MQGDSEHFPTKIGLQGLSLSPFLSWCILFANYIILTDKTCNKINTWLEVGRQALEPKDLG